MTGPEKPAQNPTGAEAEKARNTPGPRQAEGGTQQAPGVSAVKTAPPSQPADAAPTGKGDVKGAQYEPAPQQEKLKKNSRHRLTEEQVRGMSRAELRAVAHDRGYDVGPGGRNVSVQAFLKAQEEDDTLVDAEEEKDEEDDDDEA